MKKIICVMCVIITIMCGCEKPVELSTSNNLINNNTEIEIDETIVALLNELTFSETHLNMSYRLNYDYLIVNDSLYLYEDNGEIYHLNAATGYLSGLCDDPLCNHKVVTCINKYIVKSATSYNNLIYLEGIRMMENSDGFLTPENFIGYYDVEANEYTILDSWEVIPGYDVSAPIQIYSEALYYLKKESESNNNLWKCNLSNNKAIKLSDNRDMYIKGFIVDNEKIFYNYKTGEAVYAVDMQFDNKTVIHSETVSVFSIVGDQLIYSNLGNYDLSKIEWDVEKYFPSQNPFSIYLGDMNTNKSTLIMTDIAGAVSMGVNKYFITALPDKPTYLGMEVINNEKKYYINFNSGCFSLYNHQNNDNNVQIIDLSNELGINYSLNGIYYIDEDICIVKMGAVYKENDKEGIYIVTDYASDNCKFYKLNHETDN